MNNSNLSQENIELEAQQIEFKESELTSKDRAKYEVGITTPPPPRGDVISWGF